MRGTPAQALALHRGLQLDVIAVQHGPALRVVLLPPHVHKGHRLALPRLCLRSCVGTHFLQRMLLFATAFHLSEEAWGSHLSWHLKGCCFESSGV